MLSVVSFQHDAIRCKAWSWISRVVRGLAGDLYKPCLLFWIVFFARQHRLLGLGTKLSLCFAQYQHEATIDIP